MRFRGGEHRAGGARRGREAYAQIEAAIWCDQLWLSGGYAARGAALDVERIAVEALDSIARAVNPDAKRDPWRVTNAVCRYDVDPTRWTRHVNDQAIVIGWAGYDDKVQYLPPEHFLALEFRTALWEACQGGELSRCGPDGKLIVRLREDDDGFALEHVLVTLEHPEAMSVFELAQRVSAVLGQHYRKLRALDRRWTAKWPEVELMVNPNGPLSDAGSRKDNGQTGRKLVMDYYGPRVPLGGGAIYGKDPMHVDRFGARKAREMAVEAVKKGAGSAWSGRFMRRMWRSRWMCRWRCQAGTCASRRQVWCTMGQSNAKAFFRRLDQHLQEIQTLLEFRLGDQVRRRRALFRWPGVVRRMTPLLE